MVAVRRSSPELYWVGVDANSYLETMTDAINRTVTFTRDADGRVTSTELPDGRIIQATYDDNGNVLTLTLPGRPPHAFTYDNRDLTTQYAPPAATPGGPTGYAYNQDAQITTATRPDGDVITSGYDLAGRLQTLTIPRGSFGFGYDGPTGKLTSATGPGGSTQSYGYQGALLASVSSGGPVAGSAAWTYDNNFRTTGRTVNGANLIAFSYNLDGLSTAVGSLTLGRNAQNGLLTNTTIGSVTDALSYSTFAEVSGYTASAGADQLYSESYVRDNLGRFTQRTEVVEGTTTTWGYAYDTAGRLSSVMRNGAPFESYSFDANDNRQTRTTSAGTTTYAHDNQDRLLSSVGPDGPQSWMYDANGDLLNRNDSSGQTSFDYDTSGQLLSVTKQPTGDVIGYELDADNKRAVKRVNGVIQRKWLYAGGLHPVAEYDANDNLVAVFNGGYMVKNGATYRLLRDHLGSVRLVVNTSTGNVVQSLTYGPWGEVLQDTNPGFQPFGYAGGLYDPDTRLVRFGARDYDPRTGRWTCKDPLGLGAGSNLYGYCAGDPVNLIDPAGLQVGENDLEDLDLAWEQVTSFDTAWKWAKSTLEAYLLVETVRPGRISSQPRKAASKRVTKIASELGGEAAEMQFIREVKCGEKWINVLQEMKELTFTKKREYAVVRLHDGTRALVAFGEKGGTLPDSVKRTIIHSHPYHLPPTGPSPDDFQMLIDLGQKRSYILEHGQIIKFTVK